ncbi:hypothetical protein ON010_g13762 [Phytophthora cinnamomi]|nr:hypothetical protein ON010_g13762 [Phytophthora cinnamomi]
MLPVDVGTLRRAQQPPRRTTTRWHRKPEVETVPDTPTDGWVVVGRSSTRWGPRLTKAPALVEPVGRPTCWEPLRLDDEPIPDTPSDGWVTVSTAVAATESPKAPRTDHARTCALEPTVPPMITWQQLLPAVTSFAASPTPTLPRTSSNSSRNTPRELQTQDASFAASPPSRSPPLSTWLLRFDGAAKRSKTKGTRAGAGAVLTDPTNSVTWTCSIHLSDPTETNNSAEYYGLLAGLKGATTHGVNCLEIEGDSTLVVRQVLGQFATNNIRLRGLRDEVRQLLQSFESYTLKHIDRRLNQHADRLANLAVKQKRTSTACSQHDKADPCCNQWLRPQADRRDTSR